MNFVQLQQNCSFARAAFRVARSQVRHSGVVWVLLAFLSALPTVCSAIGQGVFDPIFGNGEGYVEIDHSRTFGPEQDFGHALHIQRNGRPMVAGPNFIGTAEHGNTAIARLTASGAYDSTFGYGGDGRSAIHSSIEAAGSSYYETTFAIRLDASQRPVFAGVNIHNSSYYRPFIARCPDTGCASSTAVAPGVAILFPPQLGWGNVYAYALAIDSVGRIVVAGRAEFLTNGGGCAAWVARLLPDFTVEFVQPLFFPLNPSAQFCAEYLAVTLQRDDKIVLVGKLADVFHAGDALVARLGVTGDFDVTFNHGQPKLLRFNPFGEEWEEDSATAVALDSQNRIVIGGYSQYDNADYDFAAARLQADGTLDVGFSNDGVTTVAFDLPGSDFKDLAYGVAVDYGDKIVLGGRVHVSDPFSNFDIGAVRLNANGILDDTFGTHGFIHGGLRGIDDIGFNFGADERVTAMARDRSGRIYLSGTTDRSRYWTPGLGENQFVVRLTGEGIFADGLDD